ncbi:MAG: hypothetical protein WA667_00040 [Candidatus Nitrosopolaris sp.]
MVIILEKLLTAEYGNDSGDRCGERFKRKKYLQEHKDDSHSS